MGDHRHTSPKTYISHVRAQELPSQAEVGQGPEAEPAHSPVVPPEAGVQAGLQLQAPSLAPHQAEHLSERARAKTKRERRGGFLFFTPLLNPLVVCAFCLPSEFSPATYVIYKPTHTPAVRLAHHLPPLRQNPSEQHASIQCKLFSTINQLHIRAT